MVEIFLCEVEMGKHKGLNESLKVILFFRIFVSFLVFFFFFLFSISCCLNPFLPPPPPCAAKAIEPGWAPSQLYDLEQAVWPLKASAFSSIKSKIPSLLMASEFLKKIEPLGHQCYRPGILPTFGDLTWNPDLPYLGPHTYCVTSVNCKYETDIHVFMTLRGRCQR